MSSHPILPLPLIFLEATVAVRFLILVIWLIIAVVLYAAIEAFKGESSFDLAGQVLSMAWSFAIKVKESIQPVWEIFWVVAKWGGIISNYHTFTGFGITANCNDE